MLEQLIGYDQKLFLALNGMHSPVSDFIMYWLSNKLIWIPLYAWLLYEMIVQKRASSWKIILAVALLITLTDQISVQLFKENFHRLRPCHEPALEGLVRILNGHCGGSYGFISSHACNTAGVAVFSGLILRKRFKWLLPAMLSWSLLISYSRIYLGVHYPGDIVAGFLVGAIIGFLIYRLFKLIDSQIREKRA